MMNSFRFLLSASLVVQYYWEDWRSFWRDDGDILSHLPGDITETIKQD